MQTNLAEVLDCFFWGLEVFSRRDCGLILAGLRQCQSARHADQVLTRLERHQWIKREGRGTDARFSITAAGVERLTRIEAAPSWNALWDGKWRLFTYDLPETRRAERVLLWRALQARRFGLLQRSVWVWPHPVERLLQEVVHATGIPECFCGFLSECLFLCTNSELVAASWDFARIAQSHREYLKSQPGQFELLGRTQDLQQLARVAGLEQRTYNEAFARDPLLPRSLWPPSYNGAAVEEVHQRFRSELSARLKHLAGI